MRTNEDTLRLSVVRRARCATGPVCGPARCQVGQPHTFRIPTWAQRCPQRCKRIDGQTIAPHRQWHPRGYVRRLEFCYTPKHGSWLNIAENELSCLTRQCLHGRHFGEITILQQQIEAWLIDVTNAQRGVDWQMQIADARCKLKSVYPKILL